MIDAATLTAACTTVGLGAGFVIGRVLTVRQRRRLVLRKDDGSGALRLAIIPKDDGSMELYIPNPGLKALKRGENLEAVVQGKGRSMVFRVVSDMGRSRT